MNNSTKHSSIRIAHRLIEIANQDDKMLRPMQILKLVYLCHGWMLGLYGRELIKEDVVAWPYGPVVAELYERVKSYRHKPVPLDAVSTPADSARLGSDEEGLIGQVYKGYKHLRGLQLSALTHAEGTPWAITKEEKGTPSAISNDLIKEHFSELIEQAESKKQQTNA